MRGTSRDIGGGAPPPVYLNRTSSPWNKTMEGKEGKRALTNDQIINGMWSNKEPIKLDRFLEAWGQEAGGQLAEWKDFIFASYLSTDGDRWAREPWKHITRCSDWQSQHDAWFYDRTERQRIREMEYLKAKRTKIRGTRPQGAWAFSFTYSPKWVGWTEDIAQQEMKKAVMRLVKYYKNDIEDFVAVGERGDNGLSHIHGFYHLKSNNQITTKSFKRAYDKWDPAKPMGRGHQGGYHRLCETEGDYRSYINKDEDPWFIYDIQNILSQEDITNDANEDGATT